MTGQEWANTQGAPTLLIWLREQDMIWRQVAEEVFLALRPLTPKVDVLWVMLNSLGGDLSAAYQITRRLQATAKEVRVVIPRVAKSAATLITLGCHQVVMHPMAELGPIDTQVEIVRTGKVMSRSTLDVMRSLEYLREFAMNSFVRIANFMSFMSSSSRSTPTLEHMAPAAASVMNALIEPIFSQIDPIQMAECSRLLSVSREYGMRLMEASYSKRTQDERDALLKRMSEDYPAHGFIIDVKEAQSLGLNAREATEQELNLLDLGVTFAGGKGRSVRLFQPEGAQPASATAR